MTVRRIPIERLPEVQRAVQRGLDTLAVELPREWARRFAAMAPRITPVGTLGVTTHHPGLLRASMKFSHGPQPEYADLSERTAYPVPGPVDADRDLRGLKPGEKVWVTYDAHDEGRDESYAAAIEAGHSPQRPTGWVRDTVDSIGSEAAAIEAAAVRIAEREVRRS